MAKSIASMASDRYPEPLALKNLRPIMRVFQFTPAIPVALLPVAPIVPETWVPWLLSSIGSQVWVVTL
jgi:hypothetical protein